MEGLKLIALLFALNLFIFFSVGGLLFNERPPVNDKIDIFLKTLEQPKTAYSIDFSKLTANHKTLHIIYQNDGERKDVYYEITRNGFKRTAEMRDDIIISLDGHAFGTLLVSSYDPRMVFFSEFLTGHFSVTGIGVDDLLSMK